MFEESFSETFPCPERAFPRGWVKSLVDEAAHRNAVSVPGAADCGRPVLNAPHTLRANCNIHLRRILITVGVLIKRFKVIQNDSILSEGEPF